MFIPYYMGKEYSIWISWIALAISILIAIYADYKKKNELVDYISSFPEYN